MDAISKKRNKLVKAINGNINRSLKIISWNKGNSYIKNSIDDIRQIILEQKPDILVLNELRFENDNHQAQVLIDGYTLEMDNLRFNYQESRTALRKLKNRK